MGSVGQSMGTGWRGQGLSWSWAVVQGWEHPRGAAHAIPLVGAVSVHRAICRAGGHTGAGVVLLGVTQSTVLAVWSYT